MSGMDVRDLRTHDSERLRHLPGAALRVLPDPRTMASSRCF
jgi:hypothetical protein